MPKSYATRLRGGEGYSSLYAPRRRRTTRRKGPGSGAYAGYMRPRRGGRGGYWSDLGTKYGSALGGYLGGRAVGAVSRLLGGSGAYRKRKRYTGHGSYAEVSAGEIAPLPPTFATNPRGDYVEINHREYLGDIISSSSANTFNVQQFNINAGDSLCFPWLSNIAATSFQQYQFQGLIFEYKSMSADALNSTNTALGSVVAAVNYDATDAAPTNRAQMENTDWSQCLKPSESFAVPIECKRSETWGRGLLFTRQSLTLPSGTDRKTFDLGTLSIATLGIQGTSVNLGSLYVTYKVRLYKTVQFAPQITAGFYHLIANNAAITTAYLGTTATQVQRANNMGVTQTATALTVPLARLVPNAVYYLIVLYSGSSTASLAAPTITPSGATISNYAGFCTSGAPPSNTGDVYNTGTSTVMLRIYSFYIGATPTADMTLTFSGGLIPTGTCTVDVQLIQRNGDLTNLP